MPLLHEWLAGKTDAGEMLPADRVEAYRRYVAQREGMPPDWEVCVHRGAILQERTADLCGRRGQTFPVYQCALHGECVLTRFCQKQPERICWMCDDATSTGG